MLVYVHSYPCWASGRGGRTVLVAKDALVEVSDHEGKALTERDLWLPSKELLGAGDVGLALVRVILGVFTELAFGSMVSWTTLASSSMVNSPGLPRLKGPT
jgi:hypothetical protein